jgi:hypothetical protein
MTMPHLSRNSRNYPRGGSISTQCIILFTALRIESLSKKTKEKQYHPFSNKDKRQNN